MKRACFTFLFSFIIVQLTAAQQAVRPSPMFATNGKWSLAFHGGANLWINDLNTRRVAPGGDAVLRYGTSKRFSVGVMLGYDRLVAIQFPTDAPPARTEFGYMGLKAASADVLAWYHFPPTMEVRPYVYVGVGGVAYVRQTFNNSYIPNNKYKVNGSVHVPVGFGFEIPTSQRVSFAIDFGARFMDDYTDNWKGNAIPDEEIRPGLIDWYPTGRVGFNFYFGGADDEDEDKDGLTYGEERKYGTNPYNADSDGDGLKDGEEIFRYNTDPLKADSDGDGLNDGDEVNKYQTFPNKPDTDGDGLQDGMEVLKHDTNPTNTDSDADKIVDGDEVTRFGTNPMKADTDGDAISDGEELQKHRTDPRNRDTDGGTIDDGAEVKRGTNPLDKNDDVVPEKKELKAEVGKPIILEGVVFRTGSAVVTSASEEILTLALTTLQNHPDMTVEIRGHTDNTGGRKTNERLSQRRAEAVRMWLVNRGIVPTRITAKGYGQDNPIDSNTTADGRQRNRRIEFYRTR